MCMKTCQVLGVSRLSGRMSLHVIESYNMRFDTRMVIFHFISSGSFKVGYRLRNCVIGVHFL